MKNFKNLLDRAVGRDGEKNKIQIKVNGKKIDLDKLSARFDIDHKILVNREARIKAVEIVEEINSYDKTRRMELEDLLDKFEELYKSVR